MIFLGPEGSTIDRAMIHQFWYTDGGEGLGDIRHVRTGLSCQLGAAIMLWSLGKIPTHIVTLTAATLPIDITQHRCLNLYLLDKVHCHPS